jgi:amino acid transporter
VFRVKFLISLVLLPVIAVAFIVMAVRGKPRMLWGKRGANYFTRGQQAVVCSFESIVLLFGAILGVASSLPRNWATLSLIRIDSLLSPMTLISLFFSMPLLVWGASGLLRKDAQPSLTERVRDFAVALLGMIILIADVFQIVLAARSAL